MVRIKIFPEKFKCGRCREKFNLRIELRIHEKRNRCVEPTKKKKTAERNDRGKCTENTDKDEVDQKRCKTGINVEDLGASTVAEDAMLETNSRQTRMKALGEPRATEITVRQSSMPHDQNDWKVKQKSGVTSDRGAPFSCHYCPQEFTDLRVWYDHYARFHGDKVSVKQPGTASSPVSIPTPSSGKSNARSTATITQPVGISRSSAMITTQSVETTRSVTTAPGPTVVPSSCPRTTQSWKQLRLKYLKRSLGPHHCLQCSQSFIGLRSFLNHMKPHNMPTCQSTTSLPSRNEQQQPFQPQAVGLQLTQPQAEGNPQPQAGRKPSNIQLNESQPPKQQEKQKHPVIGSPNNVVSPPPQKKIILRKKLEPPKSQPSIPFKSENKNNSGNSLITHNRYKCRLCCQVFRRLEILRSHYRTVHRVGRAEMEILIGEVEVKALALQENGLSALTETTQEDKTGASAEERKERPRRTRTSGWNDRVGHSLTRTRWGYRCFMCPPYYYASTRSSLIQHFFQCHKTAFTKDVPSAHSESKKEAAEDPPQTPVTMTTEAQRAPAAATRNGPKARPKIPAVRMYEKKILCRLCNFRTDSRWKLRSHLMGGSHRMDCESAESHVKIAWPVIKTSGRRPLLTSGHSSSSSAHAATSTVTNNNVTRVVAPVNSNLSDLPVSSNVSAPSVNSSPTAPLVEANLSTPSVNSSPSAPQVNSNLSSPPGQAPTQQSSTVRRTSDRNDEAKALTGNNNETKFQCGHCSLSFPTQTVLAKHIISHLDDKPHCCSLCTNRFYYWRELSQHVKDTHGYDWQSYVRSTKSNSRSAVQTTSLRSIRSPAEAITGVVRNVERMSGRNLSKSGSVETDNDDGNVDTNDDNSVDSLDMSKFFGCILCSKTFAGITGVKLHLQSAHNVKANCVARGFRQV